ncbi:flagellar motor switch protein FliN [Rubripirellula amarantea]|uniref:Flagellar motor switch protein FliN n=1 Tax=Rubripirellula amarantea TaxID=2527999 RepID=A0A5C5WSE8_9BACT|nr:flagellar motor switch protein FliN [Rubripirellula amarantea]MDA8744556.1 flagellar motor switch protein FliN [Rubripirellula amarantea]TWT53079.1 Flagellar motor switch protein FliN [Rubripirellula amarantea]
MADPEDKPQKSGDAAATAQDAKPTEKPKENVDTDDIEKLLEEASENLEQAVGQPAGTQNQPKPFQLGDLAGDAAPGENQPIELLSEVEMDLRVELGRTQMRLEEVLQLRSGSVVALDKLAGDPVDIFVNGRLIARGEVLVMNDNFCIRVTELVGA